MDLIGPMDVETSGGTAKHSVMVAFDPSTHFVYFIPVDSKSAPEVASAYVEQVLLEQGACDSILTDNGTEFRNKTLRDIMKVLATEHQFTPAYHARGNMAERVNRWLGDTLRTIFAHKDMRKADWPKIIKYLEFVYRNTPIVGTNITPFEAMRGRKPKLPAAMTLEGGQSASAYKSLDDTAREALHHFQLANKLVKHAFDKNRNKQREAFNQQQVRIDFEVGELVRFWNRVPARKGQGPSKLKLRNAVYEVTGFSGTMVELREQDTGKIRTAHVSQLARFKAPAMAPSRTTGRLVVDKESAQAKLWGNMDKGTKVVFHIKTEPASYLRLGEVLEVNKEDRTVQIWFYIHNSTTYDVERPMAQWVATPEYYDSSNKAVITPRPADKAKLFMRDADFSASEVDVIATGISLQRGKLPPAVITTVDEWLKKAALKDRRALRVLNEKG